MSVYLDDGDVVLHQGDTLDILRTLSAGSVDCCVTSPPYYGLRDYGVDGQIGLEETPEAFIARLVDIFAEVRRVLADHGTCWVNMGDSYASNAGGAPGDRIAADGYERRNRGERGRATGPKPKDLLMMPARLALALQADGWWVRKDIIWNKPNPMPESVRDRPTSAHEHVFLLAKSPRYFYDAEAVREPDRGTDHPRHVLHRPEPSGGLAPPNNGIRKAEGRNGAGRNLRDVWTIATEPTPEAHFATFPTELVRRCLAAGCPSRVCRTCAVPSERVVDVEYVKSPVHGAGSVVGRHYETGANGYDGAGMPRLNKQVTTTGWTDCGHDAYRPGVALDPFMGSGTTAKVARALGLHAAGIDLNPEYLAIAARRLQQLSLLGGAA